MIYGAGLQHANCSIPLTLRLVHTFAMKPSIGIYQPFYKPELVERLDDGFTALNWLSNPAPALREFALHRYIAQQKIYERHRLTGVLSPKFFSKTGLLSSQVCSWLADNP